MCNTDFNFKRHGSLWWLLNANSCPEYSALYRYIFGALNIAHEDVGGEETFTLYSNCDFFSLRKVGLFMYMYK